MLEPVSGHDGALRAFLQVGGTSVARQQLGIALTLGCERIACLAPGPLREVIALQHEAERAGARFHLLNGPRALVGLVSAADELVLFEDGLFATTAAAVGLLEAGQGVLVQPAEQGVPQGFERIDANLATAGAARVPGRLVEQLANLPPDCNAASALQRIALQAGVPQRTIPVPGSGGSIWTLIPDEDAAHALEPRWIRHRLRDGEPANASRWLARQAVRGLGPSLLHAGTGAGTIAIAAAVLALLGLGLGWFGLVATGLGLCGLGWVTREAAVMLARVEGEGATTGAASDAAYAILLDLVLIALAGWSQVPGGKAAPLAFFAPAMLIALIRIVPRAVGGRWGVWLQDRALLSGVLAAASASGHAATAIPLAALLLALIGIAAPRGEARLTRP